MKKEITPIVKFNGGNPIALCNECRGIICYVSCTENDSKYGNVLRGYEANISLSVGMETPLYCDKCKELLND